MNELLTKLLEQEDIFQPAGEEDLSQRWPSVVAKLKFRFGATVNHAITSEKYYVEDMHAPYDCIVKTFEEDGYIVKENPVGFLAHKTEGRFWYQAAYHKKDGLATVSVHPSGEALV